MVSLVVLDSTSIFGAQPVWTLSPYTRDYPGSEGGKQAHYMLRWVNTRGETGPWSETATATIGA